MTESKLNIALIDDHALLLQSLTNLLSRYDFVGNINTYPSATVFLDKAPSQIRPDVIISDILMPGITGLELLAYLKERNCGVPVIILSSITEVQTVRHALSNGAMGFLGKDASHAEMAAALLSAQKNEPYLSERLRQSLLGNNVVEEQQTFNLSPREKEILNHICDGKILKEVALEMDLSITTIQMYHKTLLKKFNFARTADLVIFAVKNGLYNPHNKS